MQNVRTLLCLALTLSPGLALADGGVCHLRDAAGTETPCQTTPPPLVPAPANMGQYCSVTYDGGGGAFTSHTGLDGDPCAGLVGSTGHIIHAGMYSLTGPNVVFERCADGHVGMAQGIGQQPLTDMYDDAVSHKRPSCSFLVSPREFPVFDAPFHISNIDNIGFDHGTGFDHALWPGSDTFDMKHEFNLPGARAQVFTLDQDGRQRDGGTATLLALTTSPKHFSTTPSSLTVGSTANFPNSGSLVIAAVEGGSVPVTYTGTSATSFNGVVAPSWATGLTMVTGGIVIQPYGWIDGHQGLDLGMAQGTDILAVADGVIDLARTRNYVGNPGCNNGPQGELYIRHRFSGGGSRYDEVYESYYAHWANLGTNPRTNQTWKTGDIVHRGERLADVNHTGCTGGSDTVSGQGANHLHFGVFRLSNTASQYAYPLVIHTGTGVGPTGVGSDLAYRNAIDPSGFTPPTSDAYDPWAWKGVDATLWCPDSTLPDQSCDRGAPSPILWRSGQTPPRIGTRGGVVW